MAFISFAGWAVVAVDPGKVGMVFLLLGITTATLIKTVVVICIAMMVAWKLEISFGAFWTAA